MSDADDDFMCDDEEEYDLEYSEDSNSEPDVDLENQYYNSKALKEDDPRAALASFTRVLELEGGDKGEWGFKALKQMIKINFKLVSHFSDFVKRFFFAIGYQPTKQIIAAHSIYLWLILLTLTHELMI